MFRVCNINSPLVSLDHSFSRFSYFVIVVRIGLLNLKLLSSTNWMFFILQIESPYRKEICHVEGEHDRIVADTRDF